MLKVHSQLLFLKTSLFCTDNISKAESQRNAEMLERSRATLIEERARFGTVLMQLATFEAEKENMQHEIDGWQSLIHLHIFFVLRIFHAVLDMGLGNRF